MKNFYESIIEDLQETNKRLNEELDDRIEYESKLINIINQRDLEIKELKYRLSEVL